MLVIVVMVRFDRFIGPWGTKGLGTIMGKVMEGGKRRVKVQLSDEVYFELLKKAGSIRRISEVIEEALRRYLGLA